MNPSDSTEIMRLIISAFGATNPMRLVTGLAIGTAASMGVHILAVAYPEAPIWKALDEYGMHWYMLLCVPLPFLTMVFGHRTPEGVARQIETLRALLNEEGASKAQRALVWRALTGKYLEAVSPDLTSAPSLKDLFEEERQVNPDPHTPQ